MPSRFLKSTSPNDKKDFSINLQNMIEKRILKPEPNKKTLTFEWYRVF